jgi:hypothetical protein
MAQRLNKPQSIPCTSGPDQLRDSASMTNSDLARFSLLYSLMFRLIEHSNTNPIWRRLVPSTLAMAILSCSFTFSGCSVVGAGLGHLADLNAAETCRDKRFDVTLASGRRLQDASVLPDANAPNHSSRLRRLVPPEFDTVVSNPEITHKELRHGNDGRRIAFWLGFGIDACAVLWYLVAVTSTKIANQGD